MKMQIRHLRAPAGNASEILPGKEGVADFPPVLGDPFQHFRKGGAETVRAGVKPSGKQRGGRKQWPPVRLLQLRQKLRRRFRLLFRTGKTGVKARQRIFLRHPVLP